MARVKTSLDHKRIRRLIWLVLTVFVLLGYSLQSVAGSVYYSMVIQAYAAVSSPPVILQNGTAGTSTIYVNKTSARVGVAAPAPIPTYYPGNYSVLTGTYVSGSVPASVETIDSDYFIVKSQWSDTATTSYNPSNYGLFGGTTLVSGAIGNLTSNDGIYMTFRSYGSATSAQTLYAHQETTTIGGINYYLQKLSSADAAGTSLSASMATTGRQLFGKFVYPLTGVSSIPASTWTMYYRAWRDTAPSIAFDAQSSITGPKATSVSWSHTTGTGSNRLLLVAVGVHVGTGTPTTVSSVTYGGASLTQVTTALYSATDPQVRTYVFRLVNPASGTNTITVTFAAETLYVGGAVTYVGVDQTTPIQTSNTAIGSGTAPSVSVTVTGSGRWLFGHLGGHREVPPTFTITEGTGQTRRWAVTSDVYKGVGSDKAVSAGLQSMSWALSKEASYVASAVTINPAIPVGHIDIDVLIRQSNGTIRTTIATNVANSGDLTSTASMLSGTYSWAAYPVVDQTDYLEIDYYVEVTTAASGISAYLRIDDSALPLGDQTRADNIYLPSEYTSEVEFTGSSNTGTWTQLMWTIDSAWTTGSVTVTIQVYNYTLGGYPTSGSGYDSYTSNSTPDTDETRTKTITTNSTDFRDSSGNWKIKVKGVKTTTTQFDFKADWVEFKPTYYSEYTVSTEFLFSSMTKNTPTQLNFTVVTQYNTTGVNVTIQVWNYSSSPAAYVTSGEGYANYASSGSNETTDLSINTNPQFYTSGGNAKIKVTGILTTNSTYQQETNQIKLVYKYNASSTYDYVLAVTEQDALNWTINLQVYDSSNIAARALNTTISFHDGTTSDQIIISGGSINQSEGPSYNLTSSATIFIKMSNLDATSSGISYIYVYLKILVPDTSTYTLYTITFEIT